MDIIIRNTGEVPIYDQITRQIKSLILKGELREGAALPSMRLLARELRISVITTKRAYEELEREDALRRAEEHLGAAVEVARTAGITLEELMQTLTILYEGEKS